jgi:hypothetical protein
MENKASVFLLILSVAYKQVIPCKVFPASGDLFAAGSGGAQGWLNWI